MNDHSTFCRCVECSQSANFGLSCYAIRLKDLVRIVRRIVGVELSEGRLAAVGTWSDPT
jgi:hypothetical protein